MSSFYEAASVATHRHSYREVIFCNTEKLTHLVRGGRLPHWAVCTLRIDTVPASLEAQNVPADAACLHRLLVGVAGERAFRYDRVILLRHGADPLFDATVEFLRQWVPGVLEQGRVFEAEVSPELSWEGLLYAIGGSKPVDR